MATVPCVSPVPFSSPACCKARCKEGCRAERVTAQLSHGWGGHGSAVQMHWGDEREEGQGSWSTEAIPAQGQAATSFPGAEGPAAGRRRAGHPAAGAGTQPGPRLCRSGAVSGPSPVPHVPALHGARAERVRRCGFGRAAPAAVYLESYVFCPGPHCVQNSYLASISPLLNLFPFCNLIKLTKRSLF